MTPSRPRPARERILAAAAQLFYEDGIRATGIDAVTARAGVARMSLYNNFSSKDELVTTYLTERHEEWLALHAARVTEGAAPRDRVLAVFDAYLDHAQAALPHGFRGCGLLNAAAELGDGDPGRAAVRGHKEQVEAILAAALTQDGFADPTGLAEQLSYLLEGANARAGLEGTPERILRARAMAQALMDAAPRTGRSATTAVS